MSTLSHWHEPSLEKFGAGIGISLLLHALIAALFFFHPWPGSQSQRSYVVRLVDRTAPPRNAPMPERPSEVEVPSPAIPQAGSPPQPSRPGSSELPVLGPVAMYDSRSIDETVTSSARREGRRDDGVTFDTKDMMYRGYLDMLRQKVESIWVYPREAAEKGIYGDLIIRFVILKDGSLGEVKVLRTSGHSMLDKAAVEALRSGIPYWPLPEGWQRQSLPITGRFIYTLGTGYYIR